MSGFPAVRRVNSVSPTRGSASITSDHPLDGECTPYVKDSQSRYLITNCAKAARPRTVRDGGSGPDPGGCRAWVHDAEDLVQEALPHHRRGYDRYDGRSSLRTWLYRIATNAFTSALAGTHRRVLPSGLGTAAPDGGADLVHAEEAAWLTPLPTPGRTGSRCAAVPPRAGRLDPPAPRRGRPSRGTGPPTSSRAERGDVMIRAGVEKVRVAVFVVQL
ncbi:sigma factor [Streptomyces sp. NPDC001759]